MTDWVKSIYNGPINYGIKQINYMITNIITIIFNSYSDKLFKINDKIIEKNEYDNDQNIFYLYPIKIEECIRDMGLNTIKIKSGIIDGIVIRVPALGTSFVKTNSSSHTVCSVDRIQVILDLVQISEQLSMSMTLINDFENTKSDDMFGMFQEIKSLLLQYFNSICITVNIVTIVIPNYISITLHNITFQENMITISNIIVTKQDDMNCRLISIDGLSFRISQYDLVIDAIDVTLSYDSYFPEIYLETKSDPTFFLKCHIKKIVVNHDLIINDINLEMINHTIILYHMTNFFLMDIVVSIICNANHVLVYDKSTNICTFFAKILIECNELDILFTRIKSMKCILDNHLAKIIMVNEFDETTPNNPIQIQNLDLVYKYYDIQIVIPVIYIADSIELEDIIIKYNTITMTCKKIIHSTDLILSDFMAKNNDFTINVISIKYTTTGNVTDIVFQNGKLIGIIPLITSITEIIKKINRPNTANTEGVTTGRNSSQANTEGVTTGRNSSQANTEGVTTGRNSSQANTEGVTTGRNSSQANTEGVTTGRNSSQANTESMTNIYIIDSQIQYYHLVMSHEFNFNIHKSMISISEMQLSNTILDVVLDNILIATISASQISACHNTIELIKIYLDPMMCDKLMKLCDMMIDSDDEDPDESPVCRTQMTQSMTVYNIAELLEDESFSNRIDLEQNVKLLLQSVDNFRMLIMDDYHIPVTDFGELQWSFDIKTTHVHLFDKLSKHDNEFLILILKNVILKNNLQKHTHEIRYNLTITSCIILDTHCENPKQKYFLKKTYGVDNFMDMIIVHRSGHNYQVTIDLHPITFHINEETMIHILSFFSTNKKIDKVEKQTQYITFQNNQIYLTINYYPIILGHSGQEMLSLQNFEVNLSSSKLNNINGLPQLCDILAKKWIDEINPYNVLQFVPNIKLVEPIATPISHLAMLTQKYFMNPHNRKNLRELIKKLSKGTTFASNMMKHGVNQIFDLFM